MGYGVIFMKQNVLKIFSRDITPACQYCVLGKKTVDGTMVLCTKSGVVSPYYRCRKFRYSPIRREPKSMPKLPDMDPSDFLL